jgi:hypothetical protein
MAGAALFASGSAGGLRQPGRHNQRRSKMKPPKKQQQAKGVAAFTATISAHSLSCTCFSTRLPIAAQPPAARNLRSCSASSQMAECETSSRLRNLKNFGRSKKPRSPRSPTASAIGNGQIEGARQSSLAHARGRHARHRQGSEGLHEAVSGGRDVFSSDPARLTEFIQAKRKRF